MNWKNLIDADSLRAALGAPDLAVVDCRFDLMDAAAGRRQYVGGHIPGAVHADLDRDLSAPVEPWTGRHPLPAAGTFAARMGELGIGDESRVVAYDASNGSLAARLWWLLRWVGHERVAVLDGGLRAWTAAGGALEPGEAAPRPRRLHARPDPAVALGVAELERLAADPSHLIVDARARERFEGAVEPIDPVAGHVPGAVSHPFSANLGSDDRFLSADELRARWLARLGGRPPEALVAMCGSGVTACHNLLALEIAGLPGARLYPGSWSEWIRDPRRPVARGAG
jgi:thiosulfate/3-mercaptopyruvate sulfurtransferase